MHAWKVPFCQMTLLAQYPTVARSREPPFHRSRFPINGSSLPPALPKSYFVTKFVNFGHTSKRSRASRAFSTSPNPYLQRKIACTKPSCGCSSAQKLGTHHHRQSHGAGLAIQQLGHQRTSAFELQKYLTSNHTRIPSSKVSNICL